MLYFQIQSFVPGIGFLCAACSDSIEQVVEANKNQCIVISPMLQNTNNCREKVFVAERCAKSIMIF